MSQGKPWSEADVGSPSAMRDDGGAFEIFAVPGTSATAAATTSLDAAGGAATVVDAPAVAVLVVVEPVAFAAGLDR